MNEHLRERVVRKLEGLSDERGYQVLDYIEFLESKYAARQTPPTNIFTRFSEAVEDRLRAGKVSATTIAETVGLMNRAFSALNNVATGVAAAGRSVATAERRTDRHRERRARTPGWAVTKRSTASTRRRGGARTGGDTGEAAGSETRRHRRANAPGCEAGC
jgi:hypothetical protein